jgi:hypothetical protein
MLHFEGQSSFLFRLRVRRRGDIYSVGSGRLSYFQSVDIQHVEYSPSSIGMRYLLCHTTKKAPSFEMQYVFKVLRLFKNRQPTSPNQKK